TYVEITLHTYFSYIKEYVVGLDHGSRIQLFQCMHTNKHRNENEYIHFNFSDKTHTRSVRLKLMEPSLLSLVASITFKPQRQLLAQIAS
ncbi:unnamed protein product, partial [Brassica oleracea var. botrytis]